MYIKIKIVGLNKKMTRMDRRRKRKDEFIHCSSLKVFAAFKPGLLTAQVCIYLKLFSAVLHWKD